MKWIRRKTEKGTVQYVCPQCHDYHEFRDDFGEHTFRENFIFCRRCGSKNGDGTPPVPVCEEKIIWHEITTRPLTEEEKAEYAESGYADYEIPEYFFSCEMPKDGQEILVATSWGVSQDLCMIDCDECNNLFELETRGDWDGVKAWADMPKYKGGESDG